MTRPPSSITCLSFRSPAIAAGRGCTPGEPPTRLLAGTAGGEVLSWGVPPLGGAPPPPVVFRPPCRRRRHLPPLARLAGHVGPVHALTVGLGGVVASAGEDRTVRLWAGTTADATGGQILKGHQGPVWGLATAPAPAGLAAEAGGGGGARSPTTPPLLLLTCASDKAAKVWALPAAGVAAAAACGAPCRSAPPPAPLRTLSGHHTDWVRACDLNASTSGGAHSACCALTGGDDGRAVLWDVEAGSAVRVVRQDGGGGGDGAAGCRPSPVRALRFLPGGASGGGWCSRPELVFAAGALDGSLTLWDARTSEVVAHLVPGAHGGGGVGGGVAHRGGVTALASCSPCAAPSTPRALLASVGADGAARAWDLRSRAEAGPPYIAACALNAVAFTPCGGGVAVGGEDGRVCMVGLWTAPPLH